METEKPPPIFVNNVTNINKMIKCICSVCVIAGSEFNYKSQVKLNIKSVNAYRKLTKYFDSNMLSYHTYQLKSDRAYRYAYFCLFVDHVNKPIVFVYYFNVKRCNTISIFVTIYIFTDNKFKLCKISIFFYFKPNCKNRIQL